MARKTQQDQLKAKAKKQKLILLVGGVILLGLLVIQGPKTMALLSGSRAAPTTNAAATPPSTATTTPAATPAPSSVAAPSLSSSGSSSTPSTGSTGTTGGSGTGALSAADPSPDPGQLEEFFNFASKDPFAAQATPAAVGSTGSSKSASSSKAKPAAGSGSSSTPATPATVAPTSAVISLNGTLMTVGVGAAFPTSGPVFDRVGALFDLASLTKTTGKVTIVGGSYANGSQTLTLSVGRPVTLQNTADGTRYTLILEPQGTQVPAGGGSSTPGVSAPSGTPTTAPTTTTTPTTTTG